MTAPHAVIGAVGPARPTFGDLVGWLTAGAELFGPSTAFTIAGHAQSAIVPSDAQVNALRRFRDEQETAARMAAGRPAVARPPATAALQARYFSDVIAWLGAGIRLLGAWPIVRVLIVLDPGTKATLSGVQVDILRQFRRGLFAAERGDEARADDEIRRLADLVELLPLDEAFEADR